jgi:hypothetical protein
MDYKIQIIVSILIEIRHVRTAFPFQYENKRGIEIIVIKLSMSCLKTSFCGISASHLFVRVRNKTCMAESLGSNQLLM